MPKNADVLHGRPTDDPLAQWLLDQGMRLRYGVGEQEHQRAIYGDRDFPVPEGLTDPQRERYVSAYLAGKKWGPGITPIAEAGDALRPSIGAIPGNPFNVGNEAGMGDLVTRGTQAGAQAGRDELDPSTFLGRGPAVTPPTAPTGHTEILPLTYPDFPGDTQTPAPTPTGIDPTQRDTSPRNIDFPVPPIPDPSTAFDDGFDAFNNDRQNNQSGQAPMYGTGNTPVPDTEGQEPGMPAFGSVTPTAPAPAPPPAEPKPAQTGPIPDATDFDPNHELTDEERRYRENNSFNWHEMFGGVYGGY